MRVKFVKEKTTVLIRNDDVSVDTTLDNIKWFCELCDKFGLEIVHCITPLGETHGIHFQMTDDDIVSIGKKKTIFDNWELITYLKSRKDEIAVHGLWHSHSPSINDILIAKNILISIGLLPTYFVPPFNEGYYLGDICGLKLLQEIPNVEHFLDSGKPQSDKAYLHSWRFGSWYPQEKLEKCFARITTAQ